PLRVADEPTMRAEIRLWTAAVLRQVPEEPMQPVPFGAVTMADDADVKIALRMDSYTTGDDPRGVPIGLYAAGGTSAPVLLDADFLLGPEAAHLNITGVSGLATKTSAVLFLLASIFEHFGRASAPDPTPGIGYQVSGIRGAVGTFPTHDPRPGTQDPIPGASDRGPTVAALCFNVKGPDLLFLDQPAELSEEDRAQYARLGVPAEPFRKVRYYAPYKP